MRRNKLLSQSSYKVVFLMRNWVALLCFLAGLLRFIGGSFLHRSNQIKVVAVFVLIRCCCPSGDFGPGPTRCFCL